MNEQAIIEKVNKIISEIRKEYTEYKGQYYLLTHVINLEFLMGKYFALMEILLHNIGENPLNPFDNAYCTEYEKNRAFIEAVTTHIDGMYKKLKEV